MRKIFSVGFRMLLALVTLASVAAAEEVRISAAASLTDAVKELVAVYQRKHPETALQPNFASSGALARQVAAGAAVDIYISANPEWMTYLEHQDLLAGSTQRGLVGNSLVFVGLPGGVRTLAELSSLQRIALGSPKVAPVGRYAEQALTRAGLYAQLQQERKLILAKDVRQALLYAERGEVDGAFVYRTDALLATQARILFSVPQELYPQVEYPAALTLAGAEKPEAQKFFAYLFSEAAQQLFAKYGFEIL